MSFLLPFQHFFMTYALTLIDVTHEILCSLFKKKKKHSEKSICTTLTINHFCHSFLEKED